MADWLARAQLVAAELCSRYKQLDSVMAYNEAQEAVMLYELCPKLRKWNFDGWVCHRIWVAHLLRKQKKAPADSPGAQNTEGNMPRGTYITEEQKQRIISDVRGGMRQKDAANKYGIGLSTVAKITQGIKKYGAVNAGQSRKKPEKRIESGGDGFVFAESMTNEQRAQYTAGVIAEVEGAAPRCENAAETLDTLPKSSGTAVTRAETLPESSGTAGDAHILPGERIIDAPPDISDTVDGVPGPDVVTVKQLIKLHRTDDILYFYEDEPGVKDGKWDFSGTELFLAYHSSVRVESMLLPEVLERTVCRIYNDDGVIRILVDRQEGNDL